MKKLLVFAVLCACAALSAGADEGEEIRPMRGSEPKFVTVADVNNLWDGTPVIMRGTIVKALSYERYLFRDATGEIVLDINWEIWRGILINNNEQVEFTGVVQKVHGFVNDVAVKRIKRI
ncbi:MAG: NirD/YgiW/YdeI family stress tolerance protein [Spirochaetaceae bacterium]|nr:NirD/YgiW/YdeI family stress tolerance protein [Spirochaetaceae bacterium]